MEELYHTFQYSLNTMGEVEDCVSQRMGRHATKRHLLEKTQLHEICANSAQEWVPEHFIMHVGVSLSVRPHPFLKDNWHIKMSGGRRSHFFSGVVTDRHLCSIIYPCSG